MSEEAALLRDMIADREERIGQIRQKTLEFQETAERLRDELGTVTEALQTERIERQTFKTRLLHDQAVADEQLSDMRAALQQQGASLHQYAQVVTKDKSTHDANYVMRMQAQLCKAMHALGILDHQLKLMERQREELHKLLRDNSTRLREEKSEWELQLLNELMVQDTAMREVENGFQSRMDGILKEKEAMEEQIESSDDEDEPDDDDDEFKDAVDEDDPEEIAAKEELLKLLQQKKEEVSKLEEETEQQAEQLEEMQAQMEEIQQIKAEDAAAHGPMPTMPPPPVPVEEATAGLPPVVQQDDEEEEEEDEESVESVDDMDLLNLARSRLSSGPSALSQDNNDDDEEDEDDDEEEEEEEDDDEFLDAGSELEETEEPTEEADGLSPPEEIAEEAAATVEATEKADDISPPDEVAEEAPGAVDSTEEVEDDVSPPEEVVEEGPAAVEEPAVELSTENVDESDDAPVEAVESVLDKEPAEETPVESSETADISEIEESEEEPLKEEPLDDVDDEKKGDAEF